MHITEAHINLPRSQRREHSAEFKNAMVMASLQPGASVSGLALQHGLNANLLFAWRRQHRMREVRLSTDSRSPAVLPVCVVAESDQTAPRDLGPIPQSDQTSSRPATTLGTPSTPTGHIELYIGGAQVRLHGQVDEPTLRLVLQLIHPAAPLRLAARP